jgi:Transposase DDE domain
MILSAHLGRFLNRLRAHAPCLNELARQSGFCRRRARKLSPHLFLLSCVFQCLQPSSSLRLQAILVGLFGGFSLSKQAFHKRLNERSSAFLQACVATLLAKPARKEVGALRNAAFGRVLLHDSTCVPLPASEAGRFPGPANQTSQAQAGLRLQLIYDLLEERMVDTRLTPFTRNDQAAAPDIVPLLRAEDLVVRDLGYFAQKALAEISLRKAFFLTRWRYGSHLRAVGGAAPIDLLAVLPKDRPFEMEVLLSDGQAVRLLAFPLPEAVANERRRKAGADRDKRLRHSEQYYKLLGWTLLLTNAPKSRLPLRAAAGVYRLRWRIEIIFKAWKSHLGLLHASKASGAQMLALVLGLLLFCVLLHESMPAEADASPCFSLLKVAQFMALYLLPAALAFLPADEFASRLHAQLLYHGCYEKRTRKNHFQLKLFGLS